MSALTKSPSPTRKPTSFPKVLPSGTKVALGVVIALVAFFILVAVGVVIFMRKRKRSIRSPESQVSITPLRNDYPSSENRIEYKAELEDTSNTQAQRPLVPPKHSPVELEGLGMIELPADHAREMDGAINEVGYVADSQNQANGHGSHFRGETR
jgi:hypothetical protein